MSNGLLLKFRKPSGGNHHTVSLFFVVVLKQQSGVTHTLINNNSPIGSAKLINQYTTYSTVSPISTEFGSNNILFWCFSLLRVYRRSARLTITFGITPFFLVETNVSDTSTVSLIFTKIGTSSSKEIFFSITSSTS